MNICADARFCCSPDEFPIVLRFCAAENRHTLTQRQARPWAAH